MSVTVNNAGVLPYAFYNNTIYFLLGREHKEVGWTGGDKLSDFGGAVELEHKQQATLNEFGAVYDEYPMVTAATEFWEETLGLFFTEKETYDLLKKQNGIVVKGAHYYEHLLRVDYNPFWIELFRNAYNYVLSCAVPYPGPGGKTGVFMYIPSCPKGYTEKTEIRWVSYADIKNEVDNYSQATSEYRPELIGTLKKLFQDPLFPKLLDEASIFVDPHKIGFIAPTEAEKILPTEEYKWPNFYPEKDKVSGAPGLITTITSQYGALLKSLPIVVTNPKLAAMFNYIDYNNQFHYEVKNFIYLKAVPDSGTKNEAPILAKSYWTNKYCPLSDGSLTNKVLGSGSYGTAYSVTGPMTKCCSKPLKFVVKSITKAIDSKQLTDIQLDSPFAETIVPKKKTDIFATEVGSLALTNYLATNSVSYNLPYFYGSALCNLDNTTYMYMQEFSTKFDHATIVDNEIDSLILQGMMAIRALYKVKLVHGDINNLNLAFNLLPATTTKQPVYKYNNTYYVGPATNKVLSFIDFGMGFVKGLLESTERLEKDKQRINNNVNWNNTVVNNVLKGDAYAAYKGYYVANPLQENAAYLRRHLLDLYLLFDTFTKKFGISKMTDMNKNVKDPMLKIFSNPMYYANHTNLISGKVTSNMDEVMIYYWDVLIKDLKFSPSIKVYDEIEFQKLNPADLMFLGNLDAVQDTKII